MKRFFAAILALILTAVPVLADYKITQRTIIGDVISQTTIYAKGVRERRESKIIMDDPEVQAMMEKMMPGRVELNQCDLKQNVTMSDEKRVYFIDYYDWTGLSPEQQKRLPDQKMEIKGTSTISATVTDSGRRQQMFGLTARWLKCVQTIENSADSCDGKALMTMEQEGWFVDLKLESDRCKIPQVQGPKGGCRPRIILKSIQNPGMLLEGETRILENNKPGASIRTETTALSTAALDQALFEIPKDYREVNSLYDITKMGDVDTSATSVMSGSDKKLATKTIAIDFFSGNVGKVDQDTLRAYISEKVSGAGFTGYMVKSQAEVATGNFANVIGVDLKKVKESGASKIGGLFGKVTGAEGASAIGNSEAEVIVTIYGNDGKTVVASQSASEKVPGKAGDAVKAALDRVLSGLLTKIK